MGSAVPELGAKLADRHALRRIVTIGWPEWSAAEAYPGLAHSRLEASSRMPELDDDSAVIAHIHSASIDGDVVDLLKRAPLVVLQTDLLATSAIVHQLANSGVGATFVGEADTSTETVGVIVADRKVGPGPAAAPPGFRVLAIITVFNEADILETTVAALQRDGVDVHVIDNWSSDGTPEIAARLAREGVITLERWPAEPPTTFNHGDLLRKVERVSQASRAEWVIHHDADERRRPPWRETSLRDALYLVDRCGFNAVNHTVLTFRPVDDSWTVGVDPESHLRHFQLEARPDLLLQIKAWRRTGEVDLASSGGHEVRFEGRRVFPYNFLLKHYPIRSQIQGERKVFRERRARWNQAERSKGWHHHYDDIRDGQAFVWPAADLSKFVDGQSQAEFLIPFIGGAEVGQAWAAKARMTEIEDEFMRDQTSRIQRRLERWVGVTFASIAVAWIRRVAWIVRPIRRALARRRWRRTGIRPDSTRT